MLPWIGWGDPVRTPGKMDKPLRLLCLWRAKRDQKSPLRRCFKPRPPLRTECAGFRLRLPVDNRATPEGVGRPGGCPASCPDAHQLARGHRHVRNWAKGQIGILFSRFKYFFCRTRRIFRLSETGLAFATLESTRTLLYVWKWRGNEPAQTWKLPACRLSTAASLLPRSPL